MPTTRLGDPTHLPGVTDLQIEVGDDSRRYGNLVGRRWVVTRDERDHGRAVGAVGVLGSQPLTLNGAGNSQRFDLDHVDRPEAAFQRPDLGGEMGIGPGEGRHGLGGAKT